ncbi:MAG TPA: efflux RND transporter periplasmic adaptor subunit [Candidatus Saccharimonadales bacterium]|jgi:HlyD family secretion protein|nr:efflux RND transporter periplasmic adaptor subunit [Candidatus Saccharimonadales bacterium]
MSIKKIMIIVGGVVAALAIVGFSVSQNQKSVVTVQTAKVARQDLLASYVTASGEVKPKTFVNVGANAAGRISRLVVKEGDRVKKGQVLAQLENVQSSADVAAMRATLQSNETDTLAAEAALGTAAAQQKSSAADAARVKLEFERAEMLYKDRLIAKAEYDTKKAAYEISSAVMAQDQARVAQAKAQVDSAHGHINTARAQLARASDVLNKTTYVAPFDGTVTNLPVREGETVVTGIQNSPGSTLMTIADMSIITTEVQVDETDIVNVKLSQPAEITIDAIPGKTFKGEVTQIGDNAIIRSSGLATSQSNTSSQEAKDFKVTITLKDAPDNLRPGLSATAKITTGTRTDAVTIPIQALTIRDKEDLEAQKKNGPKTATPSTSKKQKEVVQGVFVVRNKKAEFVTVETGLTGTTDIEVKTGLKEGDEIITGSYKILRTLRNGAGVKIDNSVIVKEES